MDQLDRQILRILHELCTVALDSLPVASKDMVFLGGSQARKTYLVLAGTFTYHHDDGEEKVDAESCSWVAEMCLWPLVKMSMEVSQVRKQYWAQIVGLSVGLTAPVNSSQDALGLLGRPGVT